MLWAKGIGCGRVRQSAKMRMSVCAVFITYLLATESAAAASGNTVKNPS
jgi:hypothetical protein